MFYHGSPFCTPCPFAKTITGDVEEGEGVLFTLKSKRRFPKFSNQLLVICSQILLR